MPTNLSRKRKATFTFSAPEASSVRLVGDFTQWQDKAIAMKRQKDGTWKNVINLEPGTYEYRFLVDGQWQDDPNCGRRAPNPFGSQNSIREIA